MRIPASPNWTTTRIMLLSSVPRPPAIDDCYPGYRVRRRAAQLNTLSRSDLVPWPEPADIAAQANVRFQGYSDRANSLRKSLFLSSRRSSISGEPAGAFVQSTLLLMNWARL